MKIVPVASIVVAIPLAAVLAACGSGTTTAAPKAPTSSSSVASPTATPSSQATATPTPTPLGALEAKRDIKLGRLVLFKNDNPDAVPSLPVTVTNHTSTPNTYDLKVDLIYDLDGNHGLLASSYVTFQYVAPGTTATEDAGFPEAMDKSIFALDNAHPVLKSATRVAPS